MRTNRPGRFGRYLGSSLALCAFLANLSPAGAELVTWGFSGKIDLVSDRDNVLDGAVTVDSPFSGRFTFETTTPDSNPANPGVGEYSGAIFGVSGRVGTLSFSALAGPSGQVFIRDHPPGIGSGDGFAASAPVGLLGDTASFVVSVGDSTGAAITSIAIPTDLLDLDLFDTSGFRIELAPDGASFSGVLTELVVIPEPATLILLLLGSVGITRRTQ